jgi:hypothetical protein
METAKAAELMVVGNLLAHLPLNIRSIASRSEAAENERDLMTKSFFEPVSLNMQCP